MQWQGEAALGRLHVTGFDVSEALGIAPEALAPWGFDWARRSVFDKVRDCLALAAGDLLQRIADGCGGASITVDVKAGVGPAAICCDGLRLTSG